MLDDLAAIEREVYGVHPEPVTCERCEKIVTDEEMQQLPSDTGLCGACWNADRNLD